MRKIKQKSFPGMQAGTSYLLVIFVILCLVTFAVLSLSGAQKDQKNVQKLADRQTAYCRANSEAAKMLKEIDLALESASAKEKIAGINGVNVTEDGEEIQIDYMVVVTENQNLEVSVRASLQSGKRRIVKWKENASSEWKEKTKLPVLGSDS